MLGTFSKLFLLFITIPALADEVYTPFDPGPDPLLVHYQSETARLQRKAAGLRSRLCLEIQKKVVPTLAQRETRIRAECSKARESSIRDAGQFCVDIAQVAAVIERELTDPRWINKDKKIMDLTAFRNWMNDHCTSTGATSLFKDRIRALDPELDAMSESLVDTIEFARVEGYSPSIYSGRSATTYRENAILREIESSALAFMYLKYGILSEEGIVSSRGKLTQVMKLACTVATTGNYENFSNFMCLYHGIHGADKSLEPVRDTLYALDDVSREWFEVEQRKPDRR